MEKLNSLLSNKRYTKEKVDSEIFEIKTNIVTSISDDIEDYTQTAVMAAGLQRLNILRDASVIMETSSYKAYEKSGKQVSWQEWQNDWIA